MLSTYQWDGSSCFPIRRRGLFNAVKASFNLSSVDVAAMADDMNCFDGVTKATEVAVAPVQGTNEEGWRLLLQLA